MGSYRIWDIIGTPTAEAGIGVSTQQNSNNFVPQVAGEITAVRWYRFNTGANRVPAGISIYDALTGASLVRVTSLTDSGTVGWQETTLGTPVVPTPGRLHKLVVEWSGSSSLSTFTAYPGQPTTAWPVPWAIPAVCQLNSASIPTMPGGTCNSANIFGHDLVFETDAEPPGQFNTEQMDLWVDDWLGTTPTKPEGNPGGYLKDILDGWDGVIDGLANSAGQWLKDFSVSALSSLDSSSGWIATALNHASTGIATRINDASNGLIAIFNRIAGVDTKLGDTADLPGGASSFSEALSAIDSTDQGRWLTRPPGTGWTLVASTTFEDERAWAQPADVYVINLTVIPPAIAPEDIAGVTAYRRAGWWAALHGDQVGERHYLDFEWCLVHDLPSRCQGILLQTRPTAEGTIEAWQYTGA
jgi:hypothetical protein